MKGSAKRVGLIVALVVAGAAVNIQADDEIQISGSLTVSKGSLSVRENTDTIRLDMAGDSYISTVQLISTQEEQIIISGDMTAPGMGLFWNQASPATNEAASDYAIRLGREDQTETNSTMTIWAGEFAMFRMSTNALYAFAVTNDVPLKYTIVEE